MTRATALVVMALAVGCARPEPVREPPRPGVVRGVVRLAGPPPKRKPIRVEGIAEIPAQEILPDDVVLDPDNGVRWAFVFIKRGLEGRSFDPDPSPVTLFQSRFRYEPHVLGIRTKQRLQVQNLDSVLHSFHAAATHCMGMPVQGETQWVHFETPGVMEIIRCDVHPWMKAWVGVLDHPFFAVTNASGRFEIGNLPQGRYTLGFWHERFQAADQEIEVSAGEAVELRVDLK